MDVGRKGKQKHLGRGLEALLGPIMYDENEVKRDLQIPADVSNMPPDKELQDSMRVIDINSIKANPYQARTVWNEQELLELAESIKANGVLQPIIVRPERNGYELIAGERRFRASKLASLDKIPALIRQATNEQLHEWALVENIHRVDLNPIERAKAYQDYLNIFSLTQSEAAQRLGEDRSVIANYIRILELPNEIRQILSEGKITMGHARAILALPTDELRRKMANRAMSGRLSVREIERLVRKYLAGTSRENKEKHIKTAHIIDLERKLSSHLGTKVNINTRRNGKKGKIIIEFYSIEEFDGIAEKLGLVCSDEI